MSAFAVKAHAVTHQGKVRDHNEDSAFISDRWPLFAVADGMGGHERGAWASERVVEALRAAVLTGSFKKDLHVVSNAIHAANDAIFASGGTGAAQPGSTVAALLLEDGQFAAVWAGDSRIYRKRGKLFARLTRDHTYVQELLSRGTLTPEQAADHAMQHVLARVVGVEVDLDLEVSIGPAKPDDRYLLCSDGLTGVVKDDEIAEALTSADSRKITEDLVNLALDRGAPDNTTVIAVICAKRSWPFFSGRASAGGRP